MTNGDDCFSSLVTGDWDKMRIFHGKNPDINIHGLAQMVYVPQLYDLMITFFFFILFSGK